MAQTATLGKSANITRGCYHRRAWQRKSIMKSTNKIPTTQNIYVDQPHELTYVVMAHRVLTDGELFSAIRVELLKRGGKHPGKGESLVITTSIGA